MVIWIADVFCGNRQRRQQLGCGKEIEARRRHPDDRVALLIECHGLPDDLRVCAEATLPEAVAEKRDLIAPWLELFGDESAASLRRDAEQGQKFQRDALPLQMRRPAASGEHVIARHPACQAVKSALRLLEPCKHLRQGPPSDSYQSFRPRVWQRTPEDGVDDAEERRIRADPNR